MAREGKREGGREGKAGRTRGRKERNGGREPWEQVGNREEAPDPGSRG